MPHKSIYVSEGDLLLFDKAEKLGLDNLSAFVTDALREFVEMKEAEVTGLQEITLEINNRDQGERTIKFVGKLLASDRRYRGQTSEGKDRWTDWEIYLTRAGKIIIYKELGSLWQDEEKLLSEYMVRNSLPGYDDEVFDFGETVPGNVLEEAAEALGKEKVEFIE